MKEKLERFLTQCVKKESGETTGKKGQNRHIGLLALICMVGIGLLLVPSKKPETKEEVAPDVAVYRRETEKRLSDMLSSVRGVGKAEVMILFRDEGRTHFAADGEESRTKDTEKITESYVLKNSGSGTQTPLVEQKYLPEAEGALVIAQGAEDAAVRAEVIEAVRAVLGVPAHRIEVLIRK
ncbi:MAG: hypothetical protein IJC78_01585 [Clostridia bacterium]|nr:hypothetical protein [Clostridia bacterium]